MFDIRLTAMLLAGPVGAMSSPTTAHIAEAGRTYPTQRGCVSRRMKGIASSTVPISHATSPAMKAIMIAWGVDAEVAMSEGAFPSQAGEDR